MSSKNIVYKVNGKPNFKNINKFDDDEEIFYRWQNPYNKNTSRSCSWGMIYESKREAIKAADGDEEYAILPGKSCMPTFKEILNWMGCFGEKDVLLIFKGYDTRCTGHDGEYVATYCKKVAVWSYEDVLNFVNENEKYND